MDRENWILLYWSQKIMMWSVMLLALCFLSVGWESLDVYLIVMWAIYISIWWCGECVDLLCDEYLNLCSCTLRLMQNDDELTNSSSYIAYYAKNRCVYFYFCGLFSWRRNSLMKIFRYISFEMDLLDRKFVNVSDSESLVFLDNCAVLWFWIYMKYIKALTKVCFLCFVIVCWVAFIVLGKIRFINSFSSSNRNTCSCNLQYFVNLRKCRWNAAGCEYIAICRRNTTSYKCYLENI